MKSLYIFLFLFILYSSPALAESACKCSTPDTKTAFNNSSLVLIGRIVKTAPSIYKKGYSEINILPTAVFKGSEEVRDKDIIIYTKLSPEECGAQLIPGLDYIIYASGVPAFLTTTSCSRNTLLDSAKDEIVKLKEILKR